MSARPRVSRLVMYKHGVAYVERSGPVDGAFALSFRRDDMNDVLKSLAVTVIDGDASVGAVAFDTPTDPDSELRKRNLLLEPGEALPGLLDGLRGRTVEVHAANQRHRGEVIGIDEVKGESQRPRRLLLLRADAGAVTMVDLDEAQRLELMEDTSRDDLEYLIDRSRAATVGESRSVAVAVRGHANDLRVSYVVPAPIWRVSYRLIRDDASVVLVAMGIVHNPVDEDLTDVQLTLTTGQPISFDIDLYHGKHVKRAVVEEQDRVAAPAPRSGQFGALAHTLDAIPLSAVAYEEAAEEVETGDRGEHFEYRLTTPISLKRGGAAMVPLTVSPLEDVRKERIWRYGSPPAPDIVLAFKNTTGIVLEEGPAVVYDEGSYAGETMVPFSAREADLRLAFAKDLAVRCQRTSTLSAVTARVRLALEAVVEEQRYEERHTLRAENDHDEPVDVIFELARTPGHMVQVQDSTAQPDDDSAAWHRFRVEVPAHASAEAMVLETWPVYREIDYQQLSPGQLEKWLTGRSLDEATVKALSGVLEHGEQAQRMDAHRQELEAERNDVYAAQGRISEQLKVLGHGGPEGDVRQRYVRELDGMQNRVTNLDNEIRRLRDGAYSARRAASAELQRVIGEGATTEFRAQNPSETTATGPHPTMHA